MEIYVLIDNQPQGPYTPAKVRKYLKTGQFQPATLGAYPGSSDWKPLEVMVRSWDDGGAPAATQPAGSKKFALWLVAGAVVLAVILAVAVRTVNAHRQPDLQGAWETVVSTVAGVKMRVVLHLSPTNGSYRAITENIDMRQTNNAIDKFVYQFPSVEFASTNRKSAFSGKLNDRADEISGTWKQGGFTTNVVWKRTTTPDVIPELLTESDYAPRTDSALQGYWMGTLQAGPMPLRVVFKIAEQAEGKFVAEMDSLDQGASNLLVSPVTYEKPKVHLECGLVGGVFEGKVSDDGAKLTGFWTQNRYPLPLTLQRTDPKVVKAELAAEQAAKAAKDAERDFSHTGPDDLPGHWKGVLQVQKIKLHVIFNIARMPDGSLAATLESPDQGKGEFPATTKYTPPHVGIEVKVIGGSYQGALKNGKLTGNWKQGGQSFPLVLTRD